jgi:hypothetical protein
MTIVLEQRLAPTLPHCCTHLKGCGGVKGAVRQVSGELRPGRHVLRTDVRQYYESVDHLTLHGILSQLIPDPLFLRLIMRSLNHSVIFEGCWQEVRKGLSRSSPMSPLLGALALLPLDRAMTALPVFYCRYMDDWVIIADSRWQLRRAVRKMHAVLAESGFTLHPDKTFIGRVEKGFDFLGCRLCLEERLRPAAAAVARVQEKIARLYEQGADSLHIGQFLRRWRSAFQGGGLLFADADMQCLSGLVAGSNTWFCGILKKN